MFQKHYSHNPGVLSALLTGLLLLVGPAQADQILACYPIPEQSAGLAWDGHVFWMGGVGESGNWIRSFDPQEGTVIDSIEAPVSDCLGLAWFEDRLAYLSPRDAHTYFVSHEGSEVGFENPHPHLGGLAGDGPTLWAATYSEQQGSVYQVNARGEVLRSLPFSGRHSRDCAFHAGRLYVADRLAQEVRVVNPESGRFIRTIPTPAINPDGLASDGEYLWLTDDGDNKEGDMLYQILIRPDGNMRFSALSHNFGSVVINQEVIWTLWVYNDGARSAHLSQLEYRNGMEEIFMPHDWVFPHEIAGGDSAALPISFQPFFEDSARIEVGLTFDLDRETYWIDLRGKGVHARRDIQIATRNINFGTARCGQYIHNSNLRMLEVENNGGEPLTIARLNFTNPSFFSGLYNFPHTFTEPGLYKIPLFFRPNRFVDSGFHAEVTVVSNDPDTPEIRIMLDGLSNLDNYNGGEVLWNTTVGNRDNPIPRVRAIQDIDDVSGDGLNDVVIATNDFSINAYHAAASGEAIPVWSYTTNANPWRQGLVHNQYCISRGGDWDGDGLSDLAIGLEGGANMVVALSGRTGEEIWIWDSHALHDGGGNIVVTQGSYDFNADGLYDVFIGVAEVDNQYASNAVVLVNGEDGQTIWIHQMDEAPRDVFSVADFTGDNVRDLFVLGENGGLFGLDGRRGREVWNNHVDGHLDNMFPLRGDINGDGSVDLCVVTVDEGLSVFNGSNGVLLWNNRNYDDLSMGIAASDVNRNGSPDIIFGDDSTVRALDGRTAEIAWLDSIYVGTHIGCMASTIDFDNDGRSDFVIGTALGRFYALSGDGYHVLWSWSSAVLGRDFSLAVPSRDLDGNGWMDVMAANVLGEVFCFAGNWSGTPPPDTTLVPKDDELIGMGPYIFCMDPAYPNPFNSAVTVPVYLNQYGQISMRVVDVMGREVFQNQTRQLAPGSYNFTWDSARHGLPAASGLYFIEINSASQRSVRKVELVR